MLVMSGTIIIYPCANVAQTFHIGKAEPIVLRVHAAVACYEWQDIISVLPPSE